MGKPKQASCCIILRTQRVTHGRLNMNTGEITNIHSEVVTEPCNTPLFGDKERASGICRACAGGWEVEDNKFANDDERMRATVQ